MKIHHDLLGMALNDFIHGEKDTRIKIHSPYFEVDEIEVALYFREYSLMPALEKMALDQCYGKILDVGAGAGSHALHLLSEGHDVSVIDISAGACEVMRRRGLPAVYQGDIMNFSGQNWDTLLLMMNGIGLFGTMERLQSFLDLIPSLLKPGGQVVFDSTNLIYLYENELGEVEMDLNREYYGQVTFQLEYKEFMCPEFQWLYIDVDTLSYMAGRKGLRVEVLQLGENYHYLARIIQ